MRAFTNTMLDSKDPVIRIEHKGTTLDFVISVTVFRRANFQEIDVFAEINKFWAGLSPEKQDTVFSFYHEIHDFFQMTQFDLSRSWSRRDLDALILKSVTKLVNFHNLENLQEWIQYRSGIQVPSNFSAVFVESIDNNTTEAKTYTRSDYMSLLAMSLALRVMIPIWSEFINRTSKETGQQFKEYYAFQLIRDTDLMKSQQMNKLMVYVDGPVSDKKENLNNILDGIASEDYTLWMVALVIVRRLCMAKLQGSEKANPVTGIYMYVWHKVTNPESSGERQVKKKETDDFSSNPAEKSSMLERVRVKTNLSLGEIVELENSLSDLVGIANKLSVNVDQQHLHNALAFSKKNVTQTVSEAQMLMLRWVFAPVIPPNGMLYVEPTTVQQSLAVLEAVLWARKHYYLAILATSQSLAADKGFTTSKVDSVSPVPAEKLQELRKYYPYVSTNNGRKNEQTVTNDVELSIDLLTKKFTDHTWRATADESLLKSALKTTNRNLIIRPDIKILITDLVIEIGSGNWN